MKNRDLDIVIPDGVTHWRCYRCVEGGGSQRLYWGTNGVIHPQWPVRDLTYETVRSRWGSGQYVVYWYGPLEGGDKRKMGPRGGGQRIHLVDLPGSPTAAPKEVTPPEVLPREPAPAASSSAEMMAAFAAMRSASPGGGMDMGTVVQLLVFMDERQERQRQAIAQEGRLIAERHRAELEAQLERERLASKERIAQIEASAHVQAKAARTTPLDPEGLVDAIGRRMQEVMTSDQDDDDDDEGSPAPANAMAVASSDLATMVNAFKDTVAPFLAVLATKLVTEPANGPPMPPSYQPRPGGSPARE